MLTALFFRLSVAVVSHICHSLHLPPLDRTAACKFCRATHVLYLRSGPITAAAAAKTSEDRAANGHPTAQGHSEEEQEQEGETAPIAIHPTAGLALPVGDCGWLLSCACDQHAAVLRRHEARPSCRDVVGMERR